MNNMINHISEKLKDALILASVADGFRNAKVTLVCETEDGTEFVVQEQLTDEKALGKSQSSHHLLGQIKANEWF